MRPHEIEITNWLRAADIAVLLERLGSFIRDKELLEIGSGSGYQLSLLRKHCSRAVGVELSTSPFAASRVVDIEDYDGKSLPFADNSFDVIYSSNALEHVLDLDSFHGEMHRVLRQDGVAIHILPSHHWRLWYTITHFVELPRRIFRKVRSMLSAGQRSRARDGLNRMGKLDETTTDPELASGQSPPSSGIRRMLREFFPRRHGERGNVVTEWYYFHPRYWRREFEKHGWIVVQLFPTGLFHSGKFLFGRSVSIPTRRRLAQLLGSSTYTYVLSQAFDGNGRHAVGKGG